MSSALLDARRSLGPVAAPLAWAYGGVAAMRRRWYARHPERVRRLQRPVVSVGNLSVGGTGKTPVAALVATLLKQHGERPAILSRGYARRDARDGVVVVHDGERLVADAAAGGDEPVMLARMLDGVAVVVSPDRHLAGCLAESRLGATVHVLDDGFQHVGLARDVDLVVVSPEDLQSERVLPAGRLREPVGAVRVADALLVTDAGPGVAPRLASAWGVGEAFEVRRALGVPRTLVGGEPLEVGPGARVLAVAAIGRPERFFADLTAVGVTVVGQMAFADHHVFTPSDARLIAQRARDCGCDFVLTTAKDAARGFPGDLPVVTGVVPLEVSVEPSEIFGSWLVERAWSIQRATRPQGSGSRCRRQS